MIRIGPYRYNLDEAVLLNDAGETVRLRSLSSKVLSLLAERANKIVPRDAFVRQVWNGRHVTDDSLVQCVGDIRRALGDSDHSIVQTFHRRGYKLVAEVDATTRPTLAILPFTTASSNGSADYFGEGTADELILRLGHCRWLRVIARSSASACARKYDDVRDIARALDARYVLEGNASRSNHRLRVYAQLLDGCDGSRIWSQRYDRRLDDVFLLQDEIASVIAGSIIPELEMQDDIDLRRRAEIDLDAWDCYQRAIWHLFRFTEEELATARELLERAIELDGSFVQAYARLAYVHLQFGWYGPFEDRPRHVKVARALATKAVNIDPKDASAHLSLGRALSLSGEACRSVDELRLAIRLNPSFAQAHFALAQVLCFLDRHREALPEINEALRLSPHDPHLWTFFHVRALAHYQADNLEAAEADARSALMEPNHTHWPFLILLSVLGRRGNDLSAADMLTRLHRLRPGFSCAVLLRELQFGEHRISSTPFIERFLGDLRRAGLPDQA